MGVIAVQLTPLTERTLRSQASQVGQTLEDYLVRLADRAAAKGMTASQGEHSGDQSKYISDPNPTPAELERLLRELGRGSPLPVLPADFSRADIHEAHD